MNKLLIIVIILLFIGSVTSTAMAAEGNSIGFDFPGYVIGIYPIGYSTAISDHQTIDFGYTYYSTNNFFDIYNKSHGRQHGYAIDIGYYQLLSPGL